jgi:hypothetical protein
MTERNPLKEFEAELADEILKVNEHVHALLDGTDGRGQLGGTYETQQITLTVPKALIHLAEFLAVMEREDKASSLEFWQYVSGVGQDDPTPRRNMTKMRRAYLERMLWNDLQFELHMLATGGLDLTGKGENAKE